MGKINNKLVKEVIKEFYQYSDVNELTVSIENSDFKGGAGKDKEFNKAIVNYNGEIKELIIKAYKEKDFSMILSGDIGMREAVFANSDLMKTLSSECTIPVVGGCNEDDEKWVIMTDVSEELSKFGPPDVPSKDTILKVLYGLGKMHSKTFNDKSYEKHDYLLNFNQWFSNSCELLSKLMEGNKDNTFVQKYLEVRPNSIEAFQKFAESFEQEKLEDFKGLLEKPENIVKAIETAPYAIGHNDLFFPNVGWDGENPVFIDWEYVGYAPIAWDVMSLYGGIPCEGLTDEEAFEEYFRGVEESGKYIDREAFVDSYKKMEAIESIMYGVREMVHAAYGIDGMPEERRSIFMGELNRLMECIMENLS